MVFRRAENGAGRSETALLFLIASVSYFGSLCWLYPGFHPSGYNESEAFFGFPGCESW